MTEKRARGRKPGVPNRRTLEVQQQLASMGVDPIAGMATIATDPKNSPELRAKMFAELATHIAPKRKAIEHTGADGGPIQAQSLDVSRLTPEARDQLRHALLVALGRT